MSRFSDQTSKNSEPIGLHGSVSPIPFSQMGKVELSSTLAFFEFEEIAVSSPFEAFWSFLMSVFGVDMRKLNRPIASMAQFR